MANYWYKMPHGLPYNVIWKLVADTAHVKLEKVTCVLGLLMDYASQQDDRGSIAGFDFRVCKIVYGYAPKTVQAILDAMQQEGVLTDDMHISQRFLPLDTPLDEQPEPRKGRTNAERQADYRARQKQKQKQKESDKLQKDASSGSNETVTDSVTDNVTRSNDSVTQNVTQPVTGVVTEVTEVTPIDIELDNRDRSRVTPSNGVTKTVTPPVTERNVTQELVTQHDKSETKLSMPRYRKEDFMTWYAAYPRKKSRDAAVKAWDSACRAKRLPAIDILLAALSWQRNLPDWIKNDGQYAPYPATYLNKGAWQDEPPRIRPQSRPGGPAPSRPCPRSDEMIDVVEHNKAVAAQIFAELTGQTMQDQEKAHDEYTDSGNRPQALGFAGDGGQLRPEVRDGSFALLDAPAADVQR